MRAMIISLSVLLTVVIAQPVVGSTSLGISTPVQGFEKLDRFAHCDDEANRVNRGFHDMVYKRNLDIILKVAGFQEVLKAGHKAGMTQQETVAIFGWTLGDYVFIDKIAGGADEVKFGVDPYGAPMAFGGHCTLTKSEVWPYIEVLVSALHKLPTAKTATLWRGSKRTSEQLGRVITGGFDSTSRSFDSALNLVTSRSFDPWSLNIVNRSGGSLWAIESHTSGKDISTFSEPLSASAEGAVLFPAGTRFEVVECSPTIVTDAIRQKVKHAERHLQGLKDIKIDIICMKEALAHPVDSDTNVIVV